MCVGVPGGTDGNVLIICVEGGETMETIITMESQ